MAVLGLGFRLEAIVREVFLLLSGDPGEVVCLGGGDLGDSCFVSGEGESSRSSDVDLSESDVPD